LTGKSTDVSTLGDDNFRATIARPRFEPKNFAENAKLLIPFAEIAEQVDCTMAQLSLAWLLAKGEDIIPIPGTSNIDHMLENAGAGDIQLPTEIVEQLDQLINDKTVKGERYSKALMESIDSERD
jgi:aryl-alcohol dehydrogenase-like predicted oxidoreductase